MKKTLITSFFFVFIFVLYKIFINPAANEEVRHKLSLIDKKLEERDHRRWYFVSSGKRSVWYNNLLKTAKKSYHLKGMAIDIMIWDIDGDWRFTTKDIAILEKLNAEVEKENPKLVGGFGTYLKEGGIYRYMVHIDTRGKKKRYYY
jgi:uncharacterized protein YcbK (DUF882 family)